MGVFEQFPYTNFHGVNLDWILKMIREHETRITALESWKVTTEGRLDSLEGRMDSAESDIDALQTQVPAASTDDAGKVLTATGDGSAIWLDPTAAGSGTIYVQFEDVTTYTPEELISLALNGSKNLICYVIGESSTYAGYHYAHLYGIYQDRLYFDSDEQFWGAVGHSTPPTGMKRCQVEYRGGDAPAWHLYNMDGTRNALGLYPSEDEIMAASER